MAQTLEEVMTASPRVLDLTDTVTAAAQAMASEDIGDVIVAEDGQLCGIVTDRDITIRVVAEGRDPSSTTLADVCTRELTTLTPSDTVDDAIRVMREQAIRRLPIVDNGRAVGIVSLGDLAIEKDPSSVLADISEAPADE